MSEIKVSLFGTPSVKIKEQEVKFPYKKVEALFYYLLVKKKSLRNKLATLLWGDMLENKAKKNLRNALYQLKKTVGEDIISTPDRFIVAVNKEAITELDLFDFKEKSAKKAVDLYQGDFLKGFLIKNASEYNDWIIEERNHYEQLYIKYLKKEILSSKKEKNFKKAVNNLESLIKIDTFNEKAYRDLMKLYSQKNNSAKAIETFKLLEKELKKELGITPDKKTKALLQDIRDKISNNLENNKEKNNFIFRKNKIDQIINNLNAFSKGKKSHSFLVSGEAGIGKTALIEQVLSLTEIENSLFLKTNCYQAEENYIFKPWKTIMQQLKEEINFKKIKLSPLWKKVVFFLFPSFLPEEEVSFDKMINFDSIEYQSLIEALLFLLSKAAEKKKIIIVFEDLHWCDKRSLFLLRNLIRENKNNNILVLATTRNQRWERIENIFSDLNEYKLLKNIKLERLSLAELKEFSNNFLPDYKFNQDLFLKMHRETEGNLFFLVEFLNLLMQEDNEKAITNMLTAKSKNILSSRFSSVSKEAQKILILASICFGKFSYQLLAAVSGQNDLKLIEILEELLSYNLINEVELNNEKYSFYQFTHSKLREFIYHKQSQFKVKILHKRIAQFIEADLEKQGSQKKQYSKLLYHYSKSGDQLKYLFYLIKEAENYLYYTHEIFPIANDQKLSRDNILYLNKEEPGRYLAKIESLFEDIENSPEQFIDFKNLTARYLNVKAHFLIEQGRYNEAIKNLREMIKNAKAVNQNNILLDAFEQLAGLGIQLEDSDLIKENAEQMYNFASELGFETKIGIALRFKGIFNLYQKNYQQAENYFKKSLKVFKNAETINKKYTLGIATAYNYLGEVERYRGDLKRADQYYNYSIELCEKKNIINGLGIFYTNSGQIYYQQKKYQLAEKQFIKALDIFNELRTVWGYSTISSSYMALIYFKDNKFRQAYKHLKKADLMLKKFYKRYWYGTFLKTEAEIAREMKKDKKAKVIFSEQLDPNYKDYAKKAVEIFKDIGTDYEISTAKNLLKN